MSDKRNTIQFQRTHWTNAIIKDKSKNRLYGYEWGDPDEENTKDRDGLLLGNYFLIKKYYLQPFVKDAVVLEIGSGGGKWTQYMKQAKRVICVDLSQEILNHIKNRLGWKNLSFYKTNGDELKGISNSSVNFIFSMDSLVRIEKSALKNYFREINRVLKDNGEVCLHLPCNSSQGSVDRGFTDLSMKDIRAFCLNNNLEIITLDMKHITHGVMLLARKRRYEN